ncbi:translation initiation factor IF-3 [Thermosporothrix hazakensis]|uniref:translation initiation factor IF-3 n=1 Tax=Thermosporothrix hazakensis TaxID=644383 RepID=UPI002012D21E|nr:translation initiation factor IF-3 [Thermosporothrix hazakensis]
MFPDSRSSWRAEKERGSIGEKQALLATRSRVKHQRSKQTTQQTQEQQGTNLLVTKEEVRPINRDFRGSDRPRETRVNERIRAREVRLIDENGEMVGVMPPARALDIAREKNLDLVEVAANSNPPVCKLMDYGRFKYEQAKKENEAKKNQKTVTLKEIRMRPRTDEHDIQVKTRKIQEFLADGDKVRVSVQFRGAEMRHPELGRKLLDQIAESLKGTATIERAPSMEGRMMSMIVSRAPGWEPPKKQAAPPSKKQLKAVDNEQSEKPVEAVQQES